MGRLPRVAANRATNQKQQKRASAVTEMVPPQSKRRALGDVTNNVLKKKVVVSQQQKPATKTSPTQTKSVNKKTTMSPEEKPLSCGNGGDKKKISPKKAMTPITAVQSTLEATTLNDDENVCPPEAECTAQSNAVDVATRTLEEWRDIDQAEADDPLFSSQYAPEIYTYMKEREVYFRVQPYMTAQPDISASMRAILVDWLIEVQENFELFHETLYLAVQLTDQYLSRKEVRREYMQLVGATCMLIAAKFEELSPPMVDHFIHLCDDAYTHSDLLTMERDILAQLDYDINVPVAYRFLRRLARAADATMETHTLARYISESTLQDYSYVTERPSRIAAASMYLALRIKDLGHWTPTLEHYSGCSVADLLPLVKRLNHLLTTPLGQTATVRSKYSHEVFFKVATLSPLSDVESDAKQQASS